MASSQSEEDHVKLPPGCHVCHTMDNLVQCGQCKVISYCGTQHQREDWPSHKAACKEVKQAYKRLEASKEKFRLVMGNVPAGAERKTFFPADCSNIANKQLNIPTRRAVESALEFLIASVKGDYLAHHLHGISDIQKICCCLIRLGRDQEAYNWFMHWTTDRPETFESLTDHDLLEPCSVWITKAGEEHHPFDILILMLLKFRIYRGFFEEMDSREETGVSLSQEQIDEMIAKGGGYISKDIIRRENISQRDFEVVGMDLARMTHQLMKHFPDIFTGFPGKDPAIMDWYSALDVHRAWSESNGAFRHLELFKIKWSDELARLSREYGIPDVILEHILQ